MWWTLFAVLLPGSKGNLRFPWFESCQALCGKSGCLPNSPKHILFILVLFPYMVASFFPPSSCWTPTSWNLAVELSTCYFLLHPLKWFSGSFLKYIFLRLVWWSVKAFFSSLQSKARTYLYLSSKTKSVHKAVRIIQLLPCPCFLKFLFFFSNVCH